MELLVFRGYATSLTSIKLRLVLGNHRAIICAPSARESVQPDVMKLGEFVTITDKTKLKLDREVGGGDLFLNCDIDLLA